MDCDISVPKRKTPADIFIADETTITKKLKVTAITSQQQQQPIIGMDKVDSSLSSNHFVGRNAPPFCAPAVMPDGDIKNLSLSDYAGRYLVILFYPADFTFVCPTEITAFNDSLAQFNAQGCDIVICSTDSEYVHYNWRCQARTDGGVGNLNVPMVSDRTRNISRSYNVLCEETGQAFRGLFIVDKAQRLRTSLVNDLPVGRSVSEALRLVKELRDVDEY
ncbi:Peroxiredoxin-1 [Coemansia sp. RSA 1933]|nr:Peroxiredoxin-1 [Coemansia sp. RSA 1933]